MVWAEVVHVVLSIPGELKRVLLLLSPGAFARSLVNNSSQRRASHCCYLLLSTNAMYDIIEDCCITPIKKSGAQR